MDYVKCRANKRLSSTLFLLDVVNSQILKVWYEEDWDILTTKDLIEEEIREYRKNPQQYFENQIGIR